MDKFVALSLSLLAMERAAEVAESESLLLSCQHSDAKTLPGQTGRASLHRLVVSSQKVGLYGRQVVTLEAVRKAREKKIEIPLPANSINSGDIVGIFAGGKPLADKPISGVVTRSTNTYVSVAFDDLPDSVDLTALSGMIQLVKLANDVTYRRIKKALESLQSYRNGRSLHLISVLFSQASLAPAHPQFASLLDGGLDDFPFHTPNLNPSQCRAVVSALSRHDMAIIHGPPGTGKTTTVVEVVLQAVRLRMKVLACAPSNIAVDNLVEKLVRAKAKVVRIGHPARLVPNVLQYSLDALLASSDSAQIILDVRQDIEKAYTRSARARNPGDKRKWRNEIKALKGELRQREEKSLKEILSRADVVLSTLTGSSQEGILKYLPDDHFDLVVIDECAQALEASCWIPLLRSPRCVLAGDHCQLPPTILSQEAADKGLSVTMMERLVKEYGDLVTSSLTTQYRMHSSIMAWPSHALYQDTLTAHDSVASHLLRDLPNVTECRETSVPLVFIDTAGCDLHELDTSDEESKGNEGEADLVVHHIKSLLNAGVLQKDIAVIAPYSLQVDLIRQRVRALSLPSGSTGSVSELEVHTVDGFQGREKEAVIISLTRSNEKGEYGFLRERRRSNVAVTRARRHLCLVGDSDTVSHEPFMKGMIEHCHSAGEVWSAQEYMNDPGFEASHHYQPKVHPTGKQEGKLKDEKKKTGSKQKPSAAKPRAGTDAASQAAHGVEAAGLHSQGQTVETLKKSADLESQDEEVRMNFLTQIEGLLESKEENAMSFPPSLTGNERRIVHELCEQFGFLHESKGQGKERCIHVRKALEYASRPAAEVPDDTQTSEDVTNDSVDETQTRTSDAKEKTCVFCGRCISLLNWELHQIQCEKLQKSRVAIEQELKLEHSLDPPLDPKTKPQPPVQKQRKPKQSSKKSSKTKQKVAAVDDDLDTLLAEMTLADATCKFPKCSKNVSLLGVRCLYCSKRYCMAHSVAEVHGCGEAAKLQARKYLRQEERRGLSSVRRSQLQVKLSKKVDEKTSARQSRGGPKNKT